MIEYVQKNSEEGTQPDLFPEPMAVQTAINPASSSPGRIKSNGAPPLNTFAEFFAGIGLVRLALEAEGWNAKFANDIDPDKFAIYRMNFPSSDFLLTDINKVKSADVPPVSLATASFPCTDLSLAGERQGLMGKESGTLWTFLRILRGMNGSRPPLVLLENVPGFLSSHSGTDFRSAIEGLNKLGYECDAVLLDALNFIPQSRLRLFIFGVQKGIPSPYEIVSNPAFLPQHSARPSQLLRALKANSDLRWRFAKFLGRIPGSRANLADILENVPVDSNLWWKAKRVRHLLGQFSPRHREALRHLLKLPRRSYATVYRRMRKGIIRAEIRCDGVAGCLRTPRGGSSRQILLIAGKGHVRVRHMTPREYARLQGAPDTFKINTTTNKALFGFGDAVCVPVVSWLAKNVINPVADSLPAGALSVGA